MEPACADNGKCRLLMTHSWRVLIILYRRRLTRFVSVMSGSSRLCIIAMRSAEYATFGFLCGTWVEVDPYMASQ